MSRYHNCERCACPGVEREFRYCGRCNIVLLQSHREPGCDDQRCVHCRGPVASGRVCASCVTLLAELGSDEPETEPEHNGYWLYHDARRRGDLDQVVAYGREHGYPRMMKDWSRLMVSQANQARQAATR